MSTMSSASLRPFKKRQGAAPRTHSGDPRGAKSAWPERHLTVRAGGRYRTHHVGMHGEKVLGRGGWSRRGNRSRRSGGVVSAHVHPLHTDRGHLHPAHVHALHAHHGHSHSTHAHAGHGTTAATTVTAVGVAPCKRVSTPGAAAGTPAATLGPGRGPGDHQAPDRQEANHHRPHRQSHYDSSQPMSSSVDASPRPILLPRYWDTSRPRTDPGRRPPLVVQLTPGPS